MDEQRPEVGLREYLEHRIDAEAELDGQRWSAHQEHHASIARNLAEYKAQSNEWRGSLSDLRSTFAQRTEIEGLENYMRSSVAELRAMIATEREERREQQSLRVGQRQGVSQTAAIGLTVLAAVGTIMGILGVLLAMSGSP